MKINYAMYLEIASKLEKRFDALRILDAFRIVPEKQAGYDRRRRDPIIFLDFKCAEYQLVYREAFAHFGVTYSHLHGASSRVGYINLDIDVTHPLVSQSDAVDKAFSKMEAGIRRESLLHVSVFHLALRADCTSGRLQDIAEEINKRIKQFEAQITGAENAGDIPAMIAEADQFFKACKMNDRDAAAQYLSISSEGPADCHLVAHP